MVVNLKKTRRDGSFIFILFMVNGIYERDVNTKERGHVGDGDKKGMV